ncbi:pitrilysin family protein [uncultured Modestobacter sp.]|uniref:M16 family metallopeptidase n=1 Tax=uncultured Modestobacter sp. TaxID=380048 RepID=UPI002607A48E|nr:pitrilysin family protein [uncultured Modestobacter sp.]
MTAALRTVLGNGLRLLVAHEPELPVAAVSLHVGVGYRDEPVGRSGFAHLFEHLVFAPRAAGGVDHIQAVQALGGSANAHTRPDHTCFYETVPPAELGAVLALGADRLRPPEVDGPYLRREVGIIEREIALTIGGRPHGGFPWQVLPPAVYRDFANAHDGYGSTADLAAATPEECRAFAARHYVPANAVLTVLGPVPPEQVLDVVREAWEPIPAGVAHPRPALDDTLTGSTSHTVRRPGLDQPAVALGLRLPDAAVARAEHLAHVALVALLDGPDGLLAQALRRAGVRGVGSRAHCGLFGSPLQARHPDTVVLSARHGPDQSGAAVAAVLHGALVGASTGRLRPAALRAAVARVATATAVHLDQPAVRCASLGLGELLHREPGLLVELPRLLTAVPLDAVVAASEELAAQQPHRVELVGDLPAVRAS